MSYVDYVPDLAPIDLLAEDFIKEGLVKPLWPGASTSSNDE
jgi:hypothetical protein